MKRSIFSIIFLICVLVISTRPYAQIPDALGKQLTGKRKLTEIMKTVSTSNRGTDAFRHLGSGDG